MHANTVTKTCNKCFYQSPIEWGQVGNYTQSVYPRTQALSSHLVTTSCHWLLNGKNLTMQPLSLSFVCTYKKFSVLHSKKSVVGGTQFNHGTFST